MNKNDQLKHYGVKGMQWGKRKKEGFHTYTDPDTGHTVYVFDDEFGGGGEPKPSDSNEESTSSNILGIPDLKKPPANRPTGRKKFYYLGKTYPVERRKTFGLYKDESGYHFGKHAVPVGNARKTTIKDLSGSLVVSKGSAYINKIFKN